MARKYKNCDDMRVDHPQGARKDSPSLMEQEVYAANQHLDADNDGWACEPDWSTRRQPHDPPERR